MADWHGTQQESVELLDALARNCTCKFGLMGRRESTCPGHDAMVNANAQHWFDTLLWLRWMGDHRLEWEMP